MKRMLLFITSLLLVVMSCANMNEPTGETANESNEEIIEENPDVAEEEGEDEMEETTPTEPTILAENLSIPWSIQKEGDVFYISERTGTIAKIENGEVVRQEVQLEHEVATEQEAGLLGFVLHSDFTENQQAIAYYTYSGSAGPTNRIVQLQLAENGWVEIDTLLDEIPSGAFHHGGRLAIGPDEKLYATTGDALNPDWAQDLDSLAGKILRMNLDGSIPEDNPFENSFIFSYGHRNAQGLTWLEDGTMYASEHGNQAFDEMNAIEAGLNYGWPLIEGNQEADEMQSPIFTSGRGNTWAPSGMDFHEEQLYVAGLRGNAVFEFNLEKDEVRELLTDYGRIRDIYIEDAFMYFITNNTDGRGNDSDTDDQLIRIGLSELE